MTLFSVVLFSHIVGTLTLFAALALEWFFLKCIESARTPEEALKWVNSFAMIRWLNVAGLLAILLSGGYLATQIGGRRLPWVQIGFLVLVTIGILERALMGPRMRRIGKAITRGDGANAITTRVPSKDPLLRLLLSFQIALTLAAVLLMTAKTDLNASLVVVGTALALGSIATAGAWRMQRGARVAS